MNPTFTQETSQRRGSLRPLLSNNAVIALCMVVTLMEGYNLIVFGSVVPLLLQDQSLTLDEATAGLIGGIVYAGALIGVLGGTALADRIGRPRVMALAAAVFALGSAFAAVAPTPEFLGAARMLTGVGVGAALTTAMTLARNHAPEGRGSLVITIAMAGVPMGGTIAALVGIFLMPLWGWRSMFWLGTAMTAVILVILLSCRITEPADVREAGLTPVQKFVGLFTGRGYIFVGLVALAAITNMTTWLGLNVWLAESMKSLGFSLTEALIFAFALTGASVIGSWFTANAADKHGSAKVGIVCTALTLAGLLGLLLGPVSLVFSLVCVALMGIGGHSAQNLINATATGAVAPHSRGTILGLTNTMAFIGSFMGPFFGGLAFASDGAPGLFTLYAGSAVLCVVISVGLYYAHRRSAHQPITGAVPVLVES
ncbi:aromatic acid/H+ symport family MFS transporter [Pseudarthrobacter sulfonivorans]|uniref:MFS transporter n=1 Tax=Pseudarthrobacter sulfonivorans TaxID=121292 RepID=UPI00168B3B76|nr:MFS transporter [Pseudarthrobacter sulfonivorans]